MSFRKIVNYMLGVTDDEEGDTTTTQQDESGSDSEETLTTSAGSSEDSQGTTLPADLPPTSAVDDADVVAVAVTDGAESQHLAEPPRKIDESWWTDEKLTGAADRQQQDLAQLKLEDAVMEPSLPDESTSTPPVEVGPLPDIPPLQQCQVMSGESLKEQLTDGFLCYLNEKPLQGKQKDVFNEPKDEDGKNDDGNDDDAPPNGDGGANPPPVGADAAAAAQPTVAASLPPSSDSTADDKEENQSTGAASNQSEDWESYMRLGKQEASYEPDMVIEPYNWWADEPDAAPPEPGLLYTQPEEDDSDESEGETPTVVLEDSAQDAETGNTSRSDVVDDTMAEETSKKTVELDSVDVQVESIQDGGGPCGQVQVSTDSSNVEDHTMKVIVDIDTGSHHAEVDGGEQHRLELTEGEQSVVIAVLNQEPSVASASATEGGKEGSSEEPPAKPLHFFRPTATGQQEEQKPEDEGSGDEQNVADDGGAFIREAPLEASYDPGRVCDAQYFWAEGDVIPRPQVFTSGEEESDDEESDRKSVTAVRAHQWCVDNMYNKKRAAMSCDSGRRDVSSAALGRLQRGGRKQRSRQDKDTYDPYKIADAHKWFDNRSDKEQQEQQVEEQNAADTGGLVPQQYFKQDQQEISPEENSAVEQPSVQDSPDAGQESHGAGRGRYESFKASVKVREVYKVRGTSVDRLHSKIHNSSKKK